MTYRIEGLSPSIVAPYRGLDQPALGARGARRVIADRPTAYPCRITLEDAPPGAALILFNHVSNDVAGPYRSAFAIYAREDAEQIATYEDSLPESCNRRILSVRGFDGTGFLRSAVLAQPGEADAVIRAMLSVPETVYIDLHTATYGCFMARVGRS